MFFKPKIADFSLACRVCKRPARLTMDAATLESEAAYYERTMPDRSRSVAADMRARAQAMRVVDALKAGAA